MKTKRSFLPLSLKGYPTGITGGNICSIFPVYRSYINSSSSTWIYSNSRE